MDIGIAQVCRKGAKKGRFSHTKANIECFKPVCHRLVELEEDTEVIGENFGLHYTKYAKRPLMNDLPMDYRKNI